MNIKQIVGYRLSDIELANVLKHWNSKLLNSHKEWNGLILIVPLFAKIEVNIELIFNETLYNIKHKIDELLTEDIMRSQNTNEFKKRIIEKKKTQSQINKLFGPSGSYHYMLDVNGFKFLSIRNETKLKTFQAKRFLWWVKIIAEQ